jgi:hypothetical protein
MESNGQVPNKCPDRRGRQLPTLGDERESQEPRQVSISPTTAANSPNQKPACNCKQAFCKKCHGCTKCECECNGPVKIIRKTRGRPPKNCSEQPPQKRSRQKIPPTVEDSQESWVPRQTQKRSNEAVAPRKNHRPQRVHTNILASPNTIAVKVIEKGKEVTTPEIKLLAEARIFSHDPARYIIFNEESVPALGASLNVTPGTTIQSIGDVVQAFDILEKDRYFSSHIGSLKERK